MADDNTREEFEANESPNTNTNLRTQIYQMTEELDGKPIDTDKYLVDNVQMTKDGKVIKKDSDGNIIKAKKIESKY
jgi:patatin-like phospholipase/acyl hydrolase